MTAAAMAITAGVVGAAGQMTQAAQAQENAYAQERSYERDQRIADQNAQIVAQQGAAREEIIRRRNREQISRSRAALAESGVDISVGTPVDVLEQSQIEGELNVLTSRYQDELAKRNLALESSFAEEQADRARRAGDRALASGVIGAGASLIGGFSAARGFSRGTLNPTIVSGSLSRGLGRGGLGGLSGRGGI